MQNIEKSLMHTVQDLGNVSQLTMGSPFGRLMEGFRPQQGFFKPS